MKIIAGLIAFHAESLFHRCQRAIVVSVASIALLVSGLASASELTGTWDGALTQGNDRFEVEWTFSEAGYLILAYTNNNGQTRSVELTTPGQQIRYVPPGGGVKTHVVNSVVQQPGRLSLVIRTTFERASDGYLDQQYISESFDFVLNPGGLTTQLVTQSTKHFGDKDLSTGGANENIAVGVLQKLGGGRQDANSEQFEKIKQEIRDSSELQKNLSRELDVLNKKARDAISLSKATRL